MSMNEVNVKERLQEYGWESNPFTFRIYPNIMVGYREEAKAVIESIDSNEKLSVVVGQTGAGKTNLLRWIHRKYASDYEVHYLPKLPKSEEELLQYLKDEVLKPNFISRWFNNYSLYNIYDDINNKINSKCVFFIDEGHEASLDVLRWLRTALDHIDNLIVVAAGLPVFVDTLKEDVNTLYNRATNILELNSLNKSETFRLIEGRIENVCGEGIKPFTQDAIVNIYESTEGFPREVLRVCDRALSFAVRENLSMIDGSDVNEVIDSDEEVNKDEEDERDDSPPLNLTDKQKRIVEILNQEDRASSSSIAEEIGLDKYSSKSHAVRSVNNILKRLMDSDLIDRERRGRSYEYFLKESTKERLNGE